MISMIYVILAIGIWNVFISLILRAKDYMVAILFKVIPFFTGLFLMFYSLRQLNLIQEFNMSFAQIEGILERLDRIEKIIETLKRASTKSCESCALTKYDEKYCDMCDSEYSNFQWE